MPAAAATAAAACEAACEALALAPAARAAARRAARAADGALPAAACAETEAGGEGAREARGRLCAAGGALLALAAAGAAGAPGGGAAGAPPPPRGGAPGLTAALGAVGLAPRAFFGECRLLLAHCGPVLEGALGGDAAALANLPRLAARFAHAELLFCKAEAFATGCFVEEHAGRARAAAWLLFLACRAEVEAGAGGVAMDLVSAFCLMLAVQARVLAAAPAEALTAEGAAAASGSDAAAALAALSAAKGVEVAQASSQLPRVAATVTAALGALGGVEALVPSSPVGDNPAADGAAASAACALGEAYVAHPEAAGGLDERLMLERPMRGSGRGAVHGGAAGAAMAAGAMTPPRPPRPSSSYHTPPRSTSGAAATHSRSVGPGMASPMTAAMQADRWVRSTLARAPSQPSQALLRAIEEATAGSGEPTLAAELEARAQAASERVFDRRPSLAATQSFGSNDHLMSEVITNVVQAKRNAGVKLYYRVLEALLAHEVARGAPKAAIEGLCRARSFHGALLACALATVEVGYSPNTSTAMTQPDIDKICDACGVTAFDVSKAVEYFVRFEPTVPRELKLALNAIDERAIERLAWQPRSSLLKALSAACATPQPQRAAQQGEAAPGGAGTSEPHGAPMDTDMEEESPRTPERETLLEEDGPDTVMRTPDRPSAFSVFRSPLKSRAGAPLPPAFAAAFALHGASDGALADGDAPSKAAVARLAGSAVPVEHFFAKVRKLAASRISDMCEKMRLPALAARQVYTVVLHVLYHRTALLYNRHLDQIILCALYGVCKVTRRAVTFRDIISCYRRHPQCSPDVFRSVVLEQSSPALAVSRRGDIIEFYNVSFVPQIKAFLLELPKRSAEGGGDLASLPHAQAATAPRGGAAPRSLLSNIGGGAVQGQAPLSPLPKMPMLSPKKVTGSNVYASPLASRKRDALLMTPRTRSLYAFVGEPTHAYQSPSKDLNYINSRINSSAGARDVAMSDSTHAAAAVVAASAGTATAAHNRSPLGQGAAAAGAPVEANGDEGGIGGVKRTRDD